MNINSIRSCRSIFTIMTDVISEMYATEVHKISWVFEYVHSWDPSILPLRFHRKYNIAMARSSAMLSSMGLCIQKLEDALICLTEMETNPTNFALLADAITNACIQYEDSIQKKMIQKKSMKSLVRLLRRLEEQRQSQQQTSTGG